MNEPVLQVLFNYLKKDAPKVTLPEDKFERACYSRWAANELIAAMLEHPMEPAEDIIFEFVMKMTACNVVAGEKPVDMFSIAADFACQCLETLF